MHQKENIVPGVVFGLSMHVEVLSCFRELRIVDITDKALKLLV